MTDEEYDAGRKAGCGCLLAMLAFIAIVALTLGRI